MLDFLLSRDDLKIIGPDLVGDRLPIVSLIPKKKSVNAVYKVLTAHKIMAGLGDFYAVRPLIDMDIPLDPGVLRLSFVHYTNKEEIDQLIDSLKADFPNGE